MKQLFLQGRRYVRGVQGKRRAFNGYKERYICLYQISASFFIVELEQII
jgi:hypothetical protein